MLFRSAWPLLVAWALALRPVPAAHRGLPRGVVAAWILISLAASLPLVLSGKQHWYYLLPSMPMFAIGAASLCMPAALRLMSRARFLRTPSARAWLAGACAVAIASAAVRTAMNAGSVVRDEATIADANAMRPLLKGERNLLGEPRLHGAWILRAYLYRLNGQSICMRSDGPVSRYFIAERGSRTRLAPPGSRRIFTGLTVELFERPAFGVGPPDPRPKG